MVSDTVHQALICHTGKRRPQIFTPTIFRLRRYVPAYAYLITGFNTPEKLGYVVWCVLAASAVLPLHSLAVDATGASL